MPSLFFKKKECQVYVHVLLLGQNIYGLLFSLTKRKTPFLGIISVENKLKHGTSIWHCASPGEPRKLKQKTINQTNSVTSATSL